MMTLIRFILGKIILILAWDATFKPVALPRDSQAQLKIDAEVQGWQLFQLEACPFCVKVRREMKRLSVKIPLREIKTDAEAHGLLMAGGKIDQVPCLMIPASHTTGTQWIYESSEIIELLQKKFNPAH